MIKNNFNTLNRFNAAAAATDLKTTNSKVAQFLDSITFGFKSKKPLIAVLPLNGVIAKGAGIRSSLNLDCFNRSLEKVFEKSKLTALCLTINSPGGSPVQSELIASRIRFLAEQKKIPVFAFVEDVAASGGYWLACAADEIYASNSSIVGSIGVISSGFGFQDAISKLGIERRIYTEGKNKSILDPFVPVKQNDVKIIKSLQKHLHEYFISYVKERRRGKLTQSDDILFNGEFWSGNIAKDYGLIDGIDNLYHFIHRRFGKNVNYEYITEKKSWIKSKIGMLAGSFSGALSDELINSIINKIEREKFKIF